MKEKHFHTSYLGSIADKSAICMEVRVKDNLKVERMPHIASFTPFYLWQYGNQVCHMNGIKYEEYWTLSTFVSGR